MVLPAPNLDDRTFQDIVDEAKRLIPRYTPEWTNHNVSDPGVALIELFAWMSEMVLYRVNQVPDRLFVHFLRWAVRYAPLPFPAGLQVTTTGESAGDDSAVVFSTVEELTIRPPVLVNALTSDAKAVRMTPVFDDLKFVGSSVACFTTTDATGKLAPGNAMLLGFAESLAGMAIRLSVMAHAQGIGVDPRKPPLAWEVWNGEAWISVDVFSDSTGGLNRNGEIVLMVPAEHDFLTLGDTSAYWLRVRLLTPVPGQPTYQASPQIDGLEVAALGATVEAEHSSKAALEVLGRSDGSPGQEFRVTFPPVLPRRGGETVRVTDSSGSVEWTEVADFSASQQADPHFIWDSASGVVRFGPRVRYPDGSVRQHGRIPRDGGEVAVTEYRYGGGASGNVGARTLTVLRSAVPYISGAVNLRPAVGGVDAETIAEAKTRGPLTLRTGLRAVTAGDFGRLTLESSIEVARARCLPAATGQGPVRMLVVPQVRTDIRTHQLDDFAITAPLMRRVTEHLDAHRIVGTAIEVGTPYYQGGSIAALLHAPAGRPLALVRQRAINELTKYVHPLAGGADGGGWLFDADLNAAALARLLAGGEGRDRVGEGPVV